LDYQTREVLLAEITRLRNALEDAGGDPQPKADQAHERYRLAAKATNDAIWDWDLKGNHVLWNEALEEAYGHPLANIETTGDWWIAQIHPDDRRPGPTSTAFAEPTAATPRCWIAAM
jgi:PAS domain-containing protein